MEVQSLNILIIDDNPDDSYAYQRLLLQQNDFNCHFQQVDMAEKGLELLRENDIDCVLLDYKLPDFDGLHVLNELTNLQNNKSLPGTILQPAIIMLTGQGEESVAVQAMQQGAHGYLSKNRLTAQDLSRSISNAMEKVSLLKRIEEKRQELEQFAYIAAHDLKNPLHRIKGFSELLLKHNTENYDEETRECLGLIAKDIGNMQNLVNDLLKYCTIGRADIAFSSVNTKETVQTALENLSAKIEKTSADIRLNELPKTIRGDATALVQLFQNLIGNALTYHPLNEKPVIEISSTLLVKDRCWLLAIKDNGIGIDPRFHKRIFMPLERLHPSEHYQGTGLGLAICNKIVERHGGKIWVDSKPGEGATFYFTLPIN